MNLFVKLTIGPPHSVVMTKTFPIATTHGIVSDFLWCGVNICVQSNAFNLTFQSNNSLSETCILCLELVN